MPYIASMGLFDPPHVLAQAESVEFAREHFGKSFGDIERLLGMFDNALIEKRHFSMPKEWYLKPHTLQERNDLYIKHATEFGVESINACLTNREFLTEKVSTEEIEAIFFVSTTGMATPSIEARIMNLLPFRPNARRIPLWGLGCAGGAAGVALAADYCRSHPKAKVLLIAVELCSLTFQLDDLSKSNLVGTSLFADGVACALIAGDECDDLPLAQGSRPHIMGNRTTLMPGSERVMGWDVKDNGLYVVFSRDIPNIIRGWLKENVGDFLAAQERTLEDIGYLVAHPGGRKILEAYQECLGVDEEMTAIPRAVLNKHGNMSSPSVLYVLEEVMKVGRKDKKTGLMTALGPGFTSELVLLEWR